jgi:hypothetical protein
LWQTAGHDISRRASALKVYRKMRRIPRAAVLALAALVMVTAAAAESPAAAESRRHRERDRDRPPPPAPPDKRDRLITAPGSPFNNRPYWQALAQCGGIYFRLNSLYSTAAIQARVAKPPDAAASARFIKKSDGARRTATAFFEAAERFLIADRGLPREDAIMTYDARATEEGDRHKTVEAAEQATTPCPALYEMCREASPKMCSEATLAGLAENGSR